MSVHDALARVRRTLDEPPPAEVPGQLALNEPPGGPPGSCPCGSCRRPCWDTPAGCPDHPKGCHPDDHTTPPTVEGEVI